MAKQYLKINDFSGGAVDAYDARDLKPNQFSKVENLMLDKRSSLNTLGGEKVHRDIPSGDAIQICPGFGLFSFDSDHDKGKPDYTEARDEGEHWMVVVDSINGQVDFYDLSRDSVISDVLFLGTPRNYTASAGDIQVLAPSDTLNITCTGDATSTELSCSTTSGLKVGMFVLGSGVSITHGTTVSSFTETTIILSAAPTVTLANNTLQFSESLKSDIIATSQGNFKFPVNGEDWGFKVGDIISLSGFDATDAEGNSNGSNDVNALRIKSVAPSITGVASVENFIQPVANREFIGLSTASTDGSDGATISGTNWTVHSPQEADMIGTLDVELESEVIRVYGTSDTTEQGIELSVAAASGEDGVYFENSGKYLISATLYHASTTVDDFIIELAGIKSHPFSITNSSAVYSVIIDTSNPHTEGSYIEGSPGQTGLRIYNTNNSNANWYVDNVNMVQDGAIIQFDEKVLRRTDRAVSYNNLNDMSVSPETGVVSVTLLPKIIFHFADEALRMCDITLSTGTKGAVPPTLKWWGYIKREQFKNATTGGNANRTIDGWKVSDNKLLSPTFLKLTDGATPSINWELIHGGADEDGNDARGAGWGLSVQDTTSGVNNVFGTWLGGRYQFATTFIYDGNQESVLYIPSTAVTFDVADDASELTVKVEGAQDQNDNTLQYDNRISGGRIYFREDGTDDDWQLFIDIDIVKGVRAKPFGDFTVWGDGDTHEARSTAIVSFAPNVDTYETLNGFSQDEDQLHIGGLNEGYKASLIANRRCFVANVKTAYAHPNLDSDPIHMRDRIMYSPINKFDTFPRSFFIDVVKGDAEEYVNLEEYADRLLAFKQRRLHIINIQDSSPSNWFLEDVKDFAGITHHSAAVKTEFGICWINEDGCFIYDGKSVKNLIFNKIAESTWEDFVTNESSVFYNPKKFYICVLADYFGGDANTYVYDFRTESWVKGSSVLGVNENRTNYVIDWNGNPTVVFQPLVESNKWNLIETEWQGMGGIGTGNNAMWHWNNIQTKRLDPKEWSDNLVHHGAGKVVLQTKDYDFGEPELIKKVYSCTVTYASDREHITPIRYAIDGSGSYDDNTFTGDFSGSEQGWKKVRAILDTPVECQSISLKINNTVTTGLIEGLKINDIALEYRILRKRVS